MKRLIAGVFTLVVLFNVPVQAAAPYEWDPTVIAFGEKRRQIEQTPVLHRKNRPFHFYGNTVRRRHYQGRTLPSLNEFQQGMRVLIFRRN